MSFAGVAVGVTGLVGAGLSYKASKDASKSASDANAAALAQQAELRKQQREDLAPYRQIGLDAIPEYKRIMSGEEMKLSAPGQWQLEESAKQMARANAARGLSGSGGAVSRSAELGRKVYAQDYNDQYNRILNALDIGQNSAVGTANITGRQVADIGAASRREQKNILDSGQSQANLYSGLGGLATGIAGLYDPYKKADVIDEAGVGGGYSPFKSSSNPLGLTPGQGL